MCVGLYKLFFAMLASIAEARWHLVAIAIVFVAVWRALAGAARTNLFLTGRLLGSTLATLLVVGPLAWLYFPELLGVRRGIGSTFFNSEDCRATIYSEPGRGL